MNLRLTKNATDAMNASASCARQLGHDHIGSEHIFLAILAIPGCEASRRLVKLGLALDDLSESMKAMISGNADGTLQRGEIVHFQMGLFQYSDTVLGDLVEQIIAEKCSYPVVPANAVAEDTENLYQYPLPEDQILREVRNKIYPGRLEGKTPEEIFEVIRKATSASRGSSPTISCPASPMNRRNGWIRPVLSKTPATMSF